jgi:hypothetical protein
LGDRNPSGCRELVPVCEGGVVGTSAGALENLFPGRRRLGDKKARGCSERVADFSGVPEVEAVGAAVVAPAVVEGPPNEKPRVAGFSGVLEVEAVGAVVAPAVVEGPPNEKPRVAGFSGVPEVEAVGAVVDIVVAPAVVEGTLNLKPLSLFEGGVVGTSTVGALESLSLFPVRRRFGDKKPRGFRERVADFCGVLEEEAAGAVVVAPAVIEGPPNEKPWRRRENDVEPLELCPKRPALGAILSFSVGDRNDIVTKRMHQK